MLMLSVKEHTFLWNFLNCKQIFKSYTLKSKKCFQKTLQGVPMVTTCKANMLSKVIRGIFSQWKFGVLKAFPIETHLTRIVHVYEACLRHCKMRIALADLELRGRLTREDVFFERQVNEFDIS